MNALPGLVPRFKICHGLKIRFAHWQPRGQARGRVLLLQGRAEFLEKYLETVGDLVARDFEVMSFDWRGQGGSGRLLSDPYKGHVPTYNDYLRDLYTLCGNWLNESEVPCFLLAHSMGGHIALRLLANQPRWFQAAMLCCPMVHVITKPYSQRQAAFIAHGACYTGFSEEYAPQQKQYRFSNMEFENNSLTSDKTRFQRNRQYLRDSPNLEIGGVTFGWLHASFQSIRRTHQRDYAQRISTPLLICESDQDMVVDNRAIREMVARLPQAKLRQLSPARHELLQEKDEIRTQLWHYFDELVAAT
ncbi:MAG TPA: alpha/beta hydrolase [Gammaproteobacteria bacterium]|nr:alpha/beta hydrolase [Gammaproteobacteria bacterium]